MDNPLIRKLERFARLSREDKAALERMGSEHVRHVRARREILREGERPQDVHLILSGWACRYKELADGRRQIVAFFLPGDLCDLNIYVLREMDHTVGTITDVTYAKLSRPMFDELMLNHPRVMQALWWESLVHGAIQREWALNLGQRDAYERLAHLMCELFLRLQSIDLTEGDSCALPVTQAELAAATGLSAVHVNRTLQELRAGGLLALREKTLTIPDLSALKRAAQFNANYLHLDHEGAHLDANEQ